MMSALMAFGCVADNMQLSISRDDSMSMMVRCLVLEREREREGSKKREGLENRGLKL